MENNDEDPNGPSCSTGACACPAIYIWGAMAIILFIFFIASRI